MSDGSVDHDESVGLVVMENLRVIVTSTSCPLVPLFSCEMRCGCWEKPPSWSMNLPLQYPWCY
jgi:hypothetical protein